jgi:hypothetical protein
MTLSAGEKLLSLKNTVNIRTFRPSFMVPFKVITSRLLCSQHVADISSIACFFHAPMPYRVATGAHRRGLHMHIRLWNGGAIWMERLQRSWSFEIAKDGGEWFLWAGRLYLNLTPPRWKPLRA